MNDALIAFSIIFSTGTLGLYAFMVRKIFKTSDYNKRANLLLLLSLSWFVWGAISAVICKLLF